MTQLKIILDTNIFDQDISDYLDSQMTDKDIEFAPYITEHPPVDRIVDKENSDVYLYIYQKSKSYKWKPSTLQAVVHAIHAKNHGFTRKGERFSEPGESNIYLRCDEPIMQLINQITTKFGEILPDIVIIQNPKP